MCRTVKPHVGSGKFDEYIIKQGPFLKETYDKNYRKSIERIARNTFKFDNRIKLFAYLKNINCLTLYM